MIMRWSREGRPVLGFCGGNRGFSLSHCLSVNSPLRIRPGYQLCKHALVCQS